MKKTHHILLILLLSLLTTQALAGKLYRWKDAQGNFYYSDQVPAQNSSLEHTQLSESGRTLTIKEAAKTPEQLQQLKKIEALQQVKKALLKKQLAEDSALLKTFQSLADIDAQVNGKINMLDSHIKITNSQSKTLKEQLVTYQGHAANFERSGKKIPARNLKNIASAQHQFDKNKAEISTFKLQKQQLILQQKKDKKRFELLEQRPEQSLEIYQAGVPSLALGELSCQQQSCSNLWEKAKNFVKKNAQSKITFESDHLLLTAPPKRNSERTLALTANKINDTTYITLDIMCLNSFQGRLTCKNQQTLSLIQHFNQLGDLISHH